jgi:hypothetical protein
VLDTLLYSSLLCAPYMCKYAGGFSATGRFICKPNGNICLFHYNVYALNKKCKFVLFKQRSYIMHRIELNLHAVRLVLNDC